METLNTIYNFALLNATDIILGIYVLLLLHATYIIYKLGKRNRQLSEDLVKAITVGKVLLDLGTAVLDKNEKLNKDIDELREKRDHNYRKHATQIAYFKKRVIAYRVAIKTTFKTAPEFIKLLQEEFYEHAKKNLTKLRKEENKLDKKEK